MQPRIPTIIITGFLGAGKTTLLNRLIDHYRSQRAVLLINEFGQVGIDGQLLTAGNYQKIELNKGSLFCICVRTDFIAEVERIAIDLKPELLMIETTGLANTADMEKMLALPTLREHIDLQACLCLVDCQNFLKINAFLETPATQVRSADLIILNKTDLATAQQVSQVAAAIRDIAPTTPLLQTTFAQVPSETLAVIRRPQLDEQALPGDGRPDPVISITLEGQGQFSQAAWDQFVAQVRPRALRMKGFVSVSGQVYHLDATTDQWQMRPTTLTPLQTNQLIIIGQKLDHALLEATFTQAITMRT